MSGKPRLELQCNDVEGDSIAITKRLHTGDYDVKIEDNGTTSMVFLTEEDARKLFNWLGVQLTRGWS